MHVTKSVSTPNIYKDHPPAHGGPATGKKVSADDNHGTKAPAFERVPSAPDHSSPRNRNSHDSNLKKGAGGNNVLEKLISPFSLLNRPSASVVSKEISGAQAVAKIDQKAILDCEVLFADCDSFLQVAKETIELHRSTHQSDSRLKRFLMGSKITRWRAKRKGNQLFVQYEQLIQRSESCEKNLKSYTEKLLNDSSSLMVQALHLKSRLTSCINYNRDQAVLLRPIMEDTKDYLRRFVTEKGKIQEMMNFYDEITNLKLAQKDTFVPWALRNAGNASHPLMLSAAMLNRDGIEARLQKLLKVIDIIQLVIQYQVPMYQQRKTNLESCTKSLHTMENILLNINAYRTFMKNTDEDTLKNTSSRLTTQSDDHEPIASHDLNEKLMAEVRKVKVLDDEEEDEDDDDDEDDEDGFVSTPAVVVNNPAFAKLQPAAKKDNSEEEKKAGENGAVVTKAAVKRPSTLEQLIAEANKTSTAIDDALFAHVHIEPYDHANCSDCAFVFGMANDCSMHLAALQHTAQETTIRLQKLLELRERLKRRAQILESIDWGGDT